MLYEQAEKEILERTKKENELIEIRGTLEEAQNIAHLGNWQWDKSTMKIDCSDELYRILGLKRTKNCWHQIIL